MAEIILGALCLIAGVVCALVASLVLWANAMGGVTNAAAVNNRPALWFAILAIAGCAGGLFLIF
jgi:hypothetical protein